MQPLTNYISSSKLFTIEVRSLYVGNNATFLKFVNYLFCYRVLDLRKSYSSVLHCNTLCHFKVTNTWIIFHLYQQFLGHCTGPRMIFFNTFLQICIISLKIQPGLLEDMFRWSSSGCISFCMYTEKAICINLCCAQVLSRCR